MNDGIDDYVPSTLESVSHSHTSTSVVESTQPSPSVSETQSFTVATQSTTINLPAPDLATDKSSQPVQPTCDFPKICVLQRFSRISTMIDALAILNIERDLSSKLWDELETLIPKFAQVHGDSRIVLL